MRKLLFSILLFTAFGCSYDIYEEISYFDNREATSVIRIDFSSSMKGEHRDMILNMILESVKGFTKQFAGDSSANKINFDSLNLKSSDTDMFYEIALDTVKGFTRDSIYTSFVKKDTLHRFTEDESRRISDFVHELGKRSIVRFKANMKEESLYFEIESAGLPWDKMASFKVGEIAEKIKGDTATKELELINTFPLQWRKNKLIRGKESFGAETSDKELPTDSMSISALKNSNYIIKYNFPGKVLKNKNPRYKISDDGKSVVFKENFYDLIKDSIDVSNEIEYKE